MKSFHWRQSLAAISNKTRIPISGSTISRIFTYALYMRDIK